MLIHASECFLFCPSLESSILRASRGELAECQSVAGIRQLEEKLLESRPKGDLELSLYDRVRRCGLQRPRSAALASWLATIALHEISGEIPSLARVGVFVCSTTAAATISYDFEERGLTEGWKLVDPFWLPHSIPSAVPTSVFASLRRTGLAHAFQGGLRGFAQAIEHATLLLTRKIIDVGIVMVAECVGTYQSKLSEHREGSVFFPSACAGIVMMRPDTGVGLRAISMTQYCGAIEVVGCSSANAEYIPISLYEPRCALIGPMLMAGCFGLRDRFSVIVKETKEVYNVEGR